MKDRKGEMCILHRTVFSHPTGKERGFIMRSCSPACPKYSASKR
jgi:hypothetical protein